MQNSKKETKDLNQRMVKPDDCWVCWRCNWLEKELMQLFPPTQTDFTDLSWIFSHSDRCLLKTDAAWMSKRFRDPAGWEWELTEFRYEENEVLLTWFKFSAVKTNILIKKYHLQHQESVHLTWNVLRGFRCFVSNTWKQQSSESSATVCSRNSSSNVCLCLHLVVKNGTSSYNKALTEPYFPNCFYKNVFISVQDISSLTMIFS